MKCRESDSSSNWWLIFGASLLGTALVTAMLNPHLLAPGQSALDWLVTALYLLLLFSGIFNLLFYVVGFLLSTRERKPAEFLSETAITSKPRDLRAESTPHPSPLLVRGGEGGTMSGESMNTAPITTRMAIVMPIYHENANEVYRRIRQTWLSLKAAGLDQHCDFYLLCDSTDRQIQRDEERAFEKLRDEFQRFAANAASEETEAVFAGSAACAASPIINRKSSILNSSPFFLLRRSDRKNFKAGNIANFLEKHGDRYDFMLVLDADSVMSGETIKRMIVRMQASSNLAILQSTVIPANAITPFARAMQFSLERTMPLFARGLYWCFGKQSVYWGHNALIRIKPFMEHAQLPTLPGKPPLGGPILSQDIVEAALLGRAGWAVEWDVEGGGSFDELPANILTYGKRDRRWCQGNFQHFPFIFWRGIKWGHRVYFANGIFAYLAGPLLLLLMVLGFVRSIGPEAAHSTPQLDGRFLFLLFTMLALPRGLALIRRSGIRNPPNEALYSGVDRSSRRKEAHLFRGIRASLRRLLQGGGIRELASMLAEILMSILIAPLLFYLHARFVLEILTGNAVSWKNQSRNPAHGLSWREAAGLFWPATLVGLLWIIAAMATAPNFLLYLVPVLCSWVGSIPLALVISNARLGRLLIRFGLFPSSLDSLDAAARAAVESSSPAHSAPPQLFPGPTTLSTLPISRERRGNSFRCQF